MAGSKFGADNRLLSLFLCVLGTKIGLSIFKSAFFGVHLLIDVNLAGEIVVIKNSK